MCVCAAASRYCAPLAQGFFVGPLTTLEAKCRGSRGGAQTGGLSCHGANWRGEVSVV